MDVYRSCRVRLSLNGGCLASGCARGRRLWAGPSGLAAMSSGRAGLPGRDAGAGGRLGRDHGFHAKARSCEVLMRNGLFFPPEPSGRTGGAARGATPSGATAIVSQAGQANARAREAGRA